MAYDREWHFTGTLGTRGQGPGEYQIVHSIAVRTAVKDWQDVTITYRPTDADHVAFADDVPLLIYDTTIDVIDLKSGSLIARRRLDGYGELTTDGRFVQVRSTPSGYLNITISKLTLSR